MGYLATSRQYGNALLGVRHQEEAHLSARICLRVFGGAILSARYCLRAVVVAQLSCAFMSMNRKCILILVYFYTGFSSNHRLLRHIIS